MPNVISQLNINNHLYKIRDDDTYTKIEINNLISSPKQNYVTVSVQEGTSSLSGILPVEGAEDTIYRVAQWDGSSYNTNIYSEYAWDGSEYILLSVKPAFGTMVHLTQTQYDNLTETAKNNGSWYFIEEE